MSQPPSPSQSQSPPSSPEPQSPDSHFNDRDDSTYNRSFTYFVPKRDLDIPEEELLRLFSQFGKVEDHRLFHYDILYTDALFCYIRLPFPLQFQNPTTSSSALLETAITFLKK